MTDKHSTELPTELKALHIERIISELETIRTVDDTELFDVIMELREWKRTNVNFNALSRTQIEALYKAQFPDSDAEWTSERTTEHLLVSIDPSRNTLEHENLENSYSKSVRAFHEDLE